MPTCRTAWYWCRPVSPPSTSYENQTKKAITNKFIAAGDDRVPQASAGGLLHRESRRGGEDLPNRCSSTSRAGSTPKRPASTSKRTLPRRWTWPTGCRNLSTAAPRTSPAANSTSWRAIPLWALSRPGRDSRVPGHHAGARQDPQLPQSGLQPASSRAEIITDLITVSWAAASSWTASHNKDLAAFRLDNLRWNKIVICTDADVDGYPDPHADPDHALPADAHPHQRGLCLYRGDPRCMRSTAKDKTYFAYTEPEKADILEAHRRGKVYHSALQGSGRERPGDDVADHHEPRDAAVSSR